MGYYCPAGTGLDWKACPRGTYSDVQGLYDESQCKPCSAGKYCDGEHLSAVSGINISVDMVQEGSTIFYFLW
jgi:hypothetical protein